MIVVLLAGLAHAELPAPRHQRRAAVPSTIEDEALLALTNDPILGRADKVEGDEVKNLVAFTFDDGPEPTTTPTVMAALLKYDVPATFFIVAKRFFGAHGEESRAVLKRELEAGFLVASHSVTHKNLKKRGTNMAFEIDESIRILAKEAERPIGMFRAPFGAIDKRGRAWLAKRGLTEVYWSIDTRDWEAKDPEQLRRKIMHLIIMQQGGVVLMHDVKQITADIVEGVLDDLEAENCRRLERHMELILPVSLHYFLRDQKKLRDIPEDVKRKTEAYREALPQRCATRPAIEIPMLVNTMFWESAEPSSL